VRLEDGLRGVGIQRRFSRGSRERSEGIINIKSGATAKDTRQASGMTDRFGKF
jgi:hypothetical protein